MKKFLRIFVPILLTIAIIAGIGWYLFIYDREFTRDMYLSAARHFEKQGNMTVASWFYDRAYDLGTGDDAVAIELARQYISDGNYTQAEKVLSRAMRDGGGVDIYVALCKIYVDQDKLIDAVDLLNGVSDPAIKTALDAMRPAAPTAPEYSDFLNQYSSVAVTAQSGTLYVNRNGEYPSIRTDAYTAPIELVGGENTLYAIAVGENGLVSPLSVFNYTVVGVIELVEFQDPAIEALIRSALQCGPEDVLYSNDLWSITSITIPAEATDYSDLRHCAFLETLVIENGVSGQLSFLNELNMLKSLHITGTAVSSEELQIIGTLTSLEQLTLNNCSIATVTPLSGLKALTYLDLGNNTVRDISAIASMTELTELNLHQNALVELSALSGCTKLTKLDVSGNSLTSLSPVSALPVLAWLDADHNAVTELAETDKFPALEYLDLSNNALVNVVALAKFTVLTTLDISDNELMNIDPLCMLLELTELDFSYNAVTTLPVFDQECKLVTIDGSYNQISDLSPLSVLDKLNTVLMTGNQEISDILVLLECDLLFYVKVDGTKINTDEQVEPLEERSVKVIYDEK